jgi:hypothetical protein
LAAGPYTREEIAAFVGATLKVLNTGEELDAGKVYRIYTQAIEKLPPWRQVLLVESHNLSVAGDDGAVNYYYKKDGSGADHGSVLGFFKPGTMKLEFNGAAAMAVENPVFWQVRENINQSLPTQAHEEGHRIDWIVGLAHGGGTYLSQQMPELKAAMQAELQSRAERKARGELPAAPVEDEQGRGVLARLGGLLTFSKPTQGLEIDGHRIDNNLYDNYREIEDHLALYEARDTDDIETFAEMISHHTMLYARYEGNERVVDFVLRKNYPHYWPAFRDMVIPVLEKHAESLLDRRQESIDGYVMNSWALARARGDALDEAAVMREAAMAAAKGTIEADSEMIRRKAELYEDPYPVALQLWAEMSEMRWYALLDEREHDNKPFVLELDQSRKNMKAYVEKAGIDVFVRHVMAMRENVRELKALSVAEDRFLSHVGLPEIRPGSDRAKAVIENFDRLIAEGGADAVKRYRESLPRERDVNMYAMAVATRLETRASLMQDDIPVTVMPEPPGPEVLEAELRALAEKGGPEAVRAAAGQMRDESKALSRYYDRLNRTATAIANLVGVSPAYLSGAEMLAMFDDLYERGGVAAVNDEIKALTVDPKVLSAYIDARDESESARVSIARDGGDISYGRKDGIYRPFTIAVKDMAQDYLPRVAADAQALVMMRDGGASMAAEIERLRMETHITVAHAIGKPWQVGSQQL